MSAVQLKVKRLHPDVPMPKYATDGSACIDISCYEPRSQPLKMGGPFRTGIASATFDTGLSFEVPPGFVLLVFSRSGHGFKHDVRLANSVGVIDSDYRGQLRVRLTSDSPRELLVQHGDRIAQAMLVPIPRMELVEVDELSETARGEGGFGSTGA